MQRVVSKCDCTTTRSLVRLLIVRTLDATCHGVTRRGVSHLVEMPLGRVASPLFDADALPKSCPSPSIIHVLPKSISRQLPSRVPYFIRLTPELDYTGTLKMQKGRLKREGIDPAVIAATGDKLYWLPTTRRKTN